MKDKKKIYKHILTLVFSALVLFIVNLLRPDRFITVREVHCRNQTGDCTEDITKKLESFTGLNFYNFKKNSSNYLDKEVAVEKYTYQIKLPGTVEYLLNEKIPEFAVTNTEKKAFLLSDSAGLILYEKDKTELPYIVVDSELPRKGEKVAPQTLFALGLVADLNLAVDVKEGTLKDGSLLIELSDNLNVIFPLEGEREVLTGSLVLLYGRIRESDKLERAGELALNNIKTIDLRYKNPVLKSN